MNYSRKILVVKKIFRSKIDIENLSRLKTSSQFEKDNFNYRNIVVNKPWGYEYLAYQNRYIAVWILYLNSGYETSLHCHPNKKTVMVPLSGVIQFTSLESWMLLRTGDGIIIEEEVFHSSKAVSQNGAILMEIESPPSKRDLVRLKDEYGRQEKGYESKKSMSKKKSGSYEHFNDIAGHDRLSRKIGDCDLVLCHHHGEWEINRSIENEKGDLFCLLSGKLHDEAGTAVISAGEIISLSDLKNGRKLYTLTDTNFLVLSFSKK